MTELTMHRTRISGQDWSGFKHGPAPTVSAPYEVQETTFVPVGEVERLRKALRDMLEEFDDKTITDELRTQIGITANTVKALQFARSALSSEGV